jgi:hypothetical protein
MSDADRTPENINPVQLSSSSSMAAAAGAASAKGAIQWTAAKVAMTCALFVFAGLAGVSRLHRCDVWPEACYYALAQHSALAHAAGQCALVPHYCRCCSAACIASAGLYAMPVHVCLHL